MALLTKYDIVNLLIKEKNVKKVAVYFPVFLKIQKKEMARRGIEPVTFALLARRSNQLS